MTAIGRRTLLAGLAAGLAVPVMRGAAAAAPVDTVEAILGESGLGGITGFAVADLATGALLETHRSDVAMPPASVVKIMTTLYARGTLGPDFSFATELLASGPVAGGVVAGDLVLAGGGDPVLDTDGIGELASALKERGLSRVGGRFLVADGALPFVAQIDADQPVQAGYNATISGLNLNFNRAHLAWGPGERGPRLAFSAPGERIGVPLDGFAAELADGGQPAHRFADGHEIWTLPKASLKGRGSVWLPVRAPGPYAVEVFAALAGIGLPAGDTVAEAGGRPLALRRSPPLDPLLRGMLRYSTNLTAEVVGLRTSQARGLAPDGLAASGAAMTDWARAQFGLGQARLVNHSGLTDGSRIAADELVAVLRAGETLGLPGLLLERPILGPDRKPVATPVRVVSKTGTLNFVSGLAGYMSGGGRRLAFAILVADPALRAKVRPEDRDHPPGGSAWLARARRQEQALLRRWAGLYA